MNRKGGRYMKQKDGSVKRVECTRSAREAAIVAAQPTAKPVQKEVTPNEDA